jgi:hypothetical protein
MARFHIDDKVRGKLTGRICTVKKVHDHDWCPDALTLADADGHLFVDSRRQYARLRSNLS